MLMLLLISSCGSNTSDPDMFTLSPEEQVAFDAAEQCIGLRAPVPHVVYQDPVPCSGGFAGWPDGFSCCVDDPLCPQHTYPSQYCVNDNTVTIAIPALGTACSEALDRYPRGWPEQAWRSEFANAIASQNGIYQDQGQQPCGGL